MKHERTKFDLRLRHPSRDLSFDCAALGLRPRVIWKKGDERQTPKGYNIGGKRADSYCSSDLKFPSRQPFREKVAATLALLKPHRARLRRLVSSGGTITLTVGWFCDRHTGERLDANLLAAMADLRVGLELFIYIPDEAQQKA